MHTHLHSSTISHTHALACEVHTTREQRSAPQSRCSKNKPQRRLLAHMPSLLDGQYLICVLPLSLCAGQSIWENEQSCIFRTVRYFESLMCWVSWEVKCESQAAKPPQEFFSIYNKKTSPEYKLWDLSSASLLMLHKCQWLLFKILSLNYLFEKSSTLVCSWTSGSF